MKKSKGKLIIICVLIAIILGSIVFMYANTVNNPLKSSNDKIVIKIDKGEGFYTLLNDLKEKGLIKNEAFIKLYLKINKVNPKLVEGTYTINSDISLKDFIKELETEKVVNVVIPEGYTIDQMGDLFEEKGLFTKKAFLEAVKNYKLPSYIKNNKDIRYPLEGFLYPDTYSFKIGVTPNEVIKTMNDEFLNVFKEVEKETGVTVPDDKIYSIVTKASLIEKEARTEKDRPLISSVIDNRLQKGMPLQIDATVIYALGKHVDKVLYKHLEINSPYNTYKVKSLPVGPIASPGKASLIAALKPAKTEYLYYLLDPKKGEHYFTNSYLDFEKKKSEFGY